MAVQDLWHQRGPLERCPECRQQLGPRSSRHGRGKRWRVSVPGHPSRAFTTKTDAQAWERELWSKGVRPGGRMTVAELLDQHLRGKADLTRDSRNALKAAAAHVREGLGDVEVGRLQRHEVQAWIAGLQSQHGPRREDGTRELRPAAWETKRRALQVLRGATRIALEAGLIETDPAEGIRIAANHKPEIRVLTIAELKRLAAACVGYEAMIWLMGTTGLRISEAVRLDVEDVRADVGRLRVARSKSGEGRDVPVPATVMDMLELEGRCGPLFTSPAGERLDADNWRARRFRPAVHEAGLDGLTPHGLRHTAVSLMIASGATVKDVQAAVGHKTTAMTLDRYAHLWDRSLDDVARRMDGLLG